MTDVRHIFMIREEENYRMVFSGVFKIKTLSTLGSGTLIATGKASLLWKSKTQNASESEHFWISVWCHQWKILHLLHMTGLSQNAGVLKLLYDIKYIWNTNNFHV